MNLAEVPMIFFTTVAQMCVGAFLVLGVVQTVGGRRFSTRVIDRIADPALLAIGPAMILGLAVSTLHMHDITHTLNVIRHWQSSWLSREIIFGCAFAALGFVFAVLQWFKLGSGTLRRVVAALTAVFGVGLLVVMSNIYYSLITVPAWHSWFTFVQFFATAALLGSLAMAVAFLAFTTWGRRAGTRTQPPESTSSRLSFWLQGRGRMSTEEAADVERFVPICIRGMVVTAMLAALVLLVATPIYISSLASQGGPALESAQVFRGSLFTSRLVLLVVGTMLLGLFTYRFADPVRPKGIGRLLILVAVAFVLTFIGELLGRAVFYQAMIRVGV
jgi:anaerobic dimethyl sulfoxide reductase subunit C (anchor subunit)